MALKEIAVERIAKAADVIAGFDPKEKTNAIDKAIELCALQNDRRGRVTVPDQLVARVDELLETPAPESTEDETETAPEMEPEAPEETEGDYGEELQ